MGQRIIIVAAAMAALATVATAQPLSGSGANLPIPSPNPGPPDGQGHSITLGSGTFTGTWTPPALSDWVGTYNATGPLPSGTASAGGTTRFDFTPLPTGVLPVGTWFWIGDVDTGAGNDESFTFTAYDAAGALITTPWLDEPIGTTPAFPSATHMPGWDWNAGTGEYFFDGTTVTSNPSVGIFMPSNTAIATLFVERPYNTCNFSLWAPVPAPSSIALLGLAGFAVRRRR